MKEVTVVLVSNEWGEETRVLGVYNSPEVAEYSLARGGFKQSDEYVGNPWVNEERLLFAKYSVHPFVSLTLV